MVDIQHVLTYFNLPTSVNVSCGYAPFTDESFLAPLMWPRQWGHSQHSALEPPALPLSFHLPRGEKRITGSLLWV